MSQRKSLLSLVLCLTFLVGIIAPVPECYVTTLVCPVKKSLAAAEPSKGLKCCSTPRELAKDPVKCSPDKRTTLKRAYTPAIELADPPGLHAMLLPDVLHKPVLLAGPALLFRSMDRWSLPPSIPILLRKQSLRI